MDAFLTAYLAESRAALDAFAGDAVALASLEAMAAATVRAMQNGGKLLVAGNGGSAADAQHIVGEFVSRLLFDHMPLPAIALTTDTSVLTAAANDYGYETVFERQVIGIGRRGDVFLGISTSGRSRNVLRALEAARTTGIVTLGFTGAAENPMTGCCDMLLRAPSTVTWIIQQIHITAAHIFCGLVERAMFPDLAGP